MTEEDYKNKFREPSKGSTENSQEFKGEKEADTRAGRALTLALDIRKFEIELYWKRATYFWGFIAVAFTGHALTYKTASDHEPWLSLLFSSLGLIFSWAWFLVNRGSKFWQQNWEGHVDLLENLTLGPLYKTLVVHSDKKCFLVAAGRFSVSKINQLLSFFITIIWIILYLKAIFPISTVLKTEFFKRGIHFAQVDVSFSPWTSRDLTPLAASTIREPCKSLMIGLQWRINVPTISCACVGHRGSPVLVVVRKRRG